MINTVINQIFQLNFISKLGSGLFIIIIISGVSSYIYILYMIMIITITTTTIINIINILTFGKNMFCKIYTCPGDSDEIASPPTSYEEKALSECFKKLSFGGQEDSLNLQAAGTVPCATAQVNFRMVKLSHALGSSGCALWLFSCSTECFNSLSCNLFLHR